MAVHRVLFVCSQNVCRSPYLATSFAITMAAIEPQPFATFSRGTHVRAEKGMCAVAARHLAGSHRWVGDPTDHVSRQLTRADIERADLILAAGIAERSAVAVLAPSARGRAFTVREAVWLSGPELKPADHRHIREEGLGAYAQVLHSRRGTLHLPGPAPGRLFRRSADADVDVLDIQDRHTQSQSAHKGLFVELDRDVDLLAKRISASLHGG